MVSGKIEWRSPFGEATEAEVVLESEVITMVVVAAEVVTGK